MKKETIIIVILCLISGIVFSQAQLTFRFANPELTGSPAVLAFDVEVKASEAGTFHRDLQLYINYSPEGFGDHVVANNAIQLTNLDLMTDNYQVVNLVDNTH